MSIPYTGCVVILVTLSCLGYAVKYFSSEFFLYRRKQLEDDEAKTWGTPALRAKVGEGQGL